MPQFRIKASVLVNDSPSTAVRLRSEVRELVFTARTTREAMDMAYGVLPEEIVALSAINVDRCPTTALVAVMQPWAISAPVVYGAPGDPEGS